MNRTIHVDLNTSSVTAAIKELMAYKERLNRKAEELRHRVAELLREKAAQGFSGATVDVLVNGTTLAADHTDVSTRDDGNITLVIAEGPDVIWVEFGTGVYFNGAAGHSPHPRGEDMGFTIGSYGEGHGKQKAWAFKGQEFDDYLQTTVDKIFVTRGNPAQMPMYKALQEIRGDLLRIATEVFST